MPGSRKRTFALRVLQLGAIGVVVAVTTQRGFDLDRFLIPKELVLHLTAVLAGLFTLRAPAPRADRLLFAFLILSGLSAVLATNPWLGFRAFAVSVSSVVVFRAARAVPARPLLGGIAVAAVVAAVTALLQTYGLDIDLFSPNRAPGGTLGNRNFIGHAAAFGLPLVLLAALGARRWMIVPACGTALVTATLVLTRSRAAWLAAAAVVTVFLLGLILRGDRKLRLRFAFVVLLAGGGVAAALIIPNTLRWRSDNPYLESLTGVASYDEGSGRGRLVQYERSLRMTASHPLLGVGPGNWPVVYPQYARRADPSLDPGEPGMTHNPWPSSDWIAFISERGPVAAVLLGLFFATLALHGFRQLLRAADASAALHAIALLGTIAGALATGAFDAVLLLGAPALLVWSALGALSQTTLSPLAGGGGTLSPVEEGWRERGEGRVRGDDAHAEVNSDIASQTGRIPTSRRLSLAAALILLVISAAGAARNIAQLVAMELLTSGSVPRAAQVDPGSYRAHLRLARSGKRSERCAHARAARDLFPNAHAARSVARGCE